MKTREDPLPHVFSPSFFPIVEIIQLIIVIRSSTENIFASIERTELYSKLIPISGFNLNFQNYSGVLSQSEA